METTFANSAPPDRETTTAVFELAGVKNASTFATLPYASRQRPFRRDANRSSMAIAGRSAARSEAKAEGVGTVADVALVLLTVGLFWVLAVVVRAVERL